MNNVSVIKISKDRSLFVAAIFSFIAATATAGESSLVKPERQTFTLLKDDAGKGVVGASVVIGVYPQDTTLEKIGPAIAKLNDAEKLASPEALILKLFELQRAGDLNGIKSLFHKAPDQAFAQQVFKDAEAVKKNALESKGLQFVSCALVGDKTRIAYKQLAPTGRSFTRSMFMMNTESGMRFIRPEEDLELPAWIISAFPAWLPATERGFVAGEQHVTVPLPLKPRSDDIKDKEIARQNEVTLYVRVDPAVAGNVSTYVKKVAATYVSGTDKDVLELWDKAARDEMLNSPSLEEETRKIRDFYKEAGDSVKPLFTISAGKVVYVYIQAAVKDSDEQVKLLRLSNADGQLLLSQGDDQSRFADVTLGKPQVLFSLMQKMKRKP